MKRKKNVRLQKLKRKKNVWILELGPQALQLACPARKASRASHPMKERGSGPKQLESTPSRWTRSHPPQKSLFGTGRIPTGFHPENNQADTDQSLCIGNVFPYLWISLGMSKGFLYSNLEGWYYRPPGPIPSATGQRLPQPQESEIRSLKFEI